MTDDFINHLLSKHQSCLDCPSNEVIKNLFEDCLSLLFPYFSDKRLASSDLIQDRIKSIHERIQNMLTTHSGLCSASPSSVADDFTSALPELEKKIQMDVDAIYEGDPAADSKEEIIRSYPGFYAIAAYRIAHLLHNLNIKVIPRIITEGAHEKTGIDIHPAAQIDHSFCIDHGTGIVIGETTVIGPHVKLYQGVTLGAISVDKVDADKKRHPTIEHHTVVYANATILGGETTIGHHSIIAL